MDMENVPITKETIQLMENREPLLLKLEEYKKRESDLLHPRKQVDATYKIAVLEPLLKTGVVVLDEVRKALVERLGSCDEENLRTAWDVIGDYVETGGKNLHRGTGLPKVEHGEASII